MQTALQFIKLQEGFRARAYRCPAGIWTVGFGTTSGVNESTIVYEHQASMLLSRDVEPIWNSLPTSLNPNQRRALTSFIYNVGTAAFSRSTLRKLVLANPDDPAIREEFLRWRYSGGKPSRGLQARRQREANLYFTPCDHSSSPC